MKRNWTSEIVTIGKMYELNTDSLIDTSMAYQRPYQVGWNHSEKLDKWIDSVLRGWFTQPFQIREVSGIWQIVDAKQRLGASFKIINSGYQPENMIEPFDVLNGKTFDFWPKEFQNDFKNCEIMLVSHDFPIDEDLVEYFIRVNKGGIPLTNAGAKRGKFVDKIIALNGVINNPVWAKLGFDRLTTESILMQLINSLESESPNHASKELVDWFIAYQFKTSLVGKIDKAVNLFGGIVESVSVLESEDYKKSFKRCTKKLHVESILYALLETDTKKSCDDLNMSLIDFFGMDKKHASKVRLDYLEASSNGTASSESIKTRHTIMLNVVNNTFTRFVKPEAVKPEAVKPEAVKPENDYFSGIHLQLTEMEKSKILDHCNSLENWSITEIKLSGKMTPVIQWKKGDKTNNEPIHRILAK